MPMQADARLEVGLDYLLTGGMLWLRQYEPESLRLLSRLWRDLPDPLAARLAGRVMAGPPDIEDADSRAYEIARLLTEMRDADARPLPPEASALLDAFERAKGGLVTPSVRTQSMAIKQTDASAKAAISGKEMLGLTPVELMWLLREPVVRQTNPWEDPRRSLIALWQEVAPRRPLTALKVLRLLAAEHTWPVDTWQVTLSVLIEIKRKSHQGIAFRWVAPLLRWAPDTFLSSKEVAWTIGRWLLQMAQSIEGQHGELFWALWDRLAKVFFSLPVSLDRKKSLLDAAINEPPGRLTEALLHRFFALEPKAGAGIPDEVVSRLRLVVFGNGDGALLGRVILARHLTPLLVTDPGWVQQYLIPKFAWSDPEESAALWNGLISSGSINPKVLVVLEKPFLETLRCHDNDVHGSKQRLWWIFAKICIEMPGFIDPGDAQDLLRSAGPEARSHVAFQIYRMMPKDPLKAAAFWDARVAPWIDAAWPRDRDLHDEDSSEALASAAILSGKSFPAALDLIEQLLVHCDQYYRIVQAVVKTELPERFPREVLLLLRTTINASDYSWEASNLRSLLGRLKAACPVIETDRAYVKLDTDLQRQGR